MNYFFKHFLIFSFNSFNSFNTNFFKSSLNFADLNLAKLNNYSKFFFSKILKYYAYNAFGNFFFMNFLNLYSKFEFCTVFLDTYTLNSNTMLRFNILFSTLGINFVKHEFFSNKNLVLTYNKIKTSKFSRGLLTVFKFIFKYYLNFIFLLIFNYSNFFFRLIFLMFKKNILLFFF